MCSDTYRLISTGTIYYCWKEDGHRGPHRRLPYREAVEREAASPRRERE